MWSGCEGAEPTCVSGGGFQKLTARAWNQPDWECVAEAPLGLAQRFHGHRLSQEWVLQGPRRILWAVSVSALKMEEMKQLPGPTSWKTLLLQGYWRLNKAGAGCYHSTAPAAKPCRAWDCETCCLLLRASLVFLGVSFSLSLPFSLQLLLLTLFELLNCSYLNPWGLSFPNPSPHPSVAGRGSEWVAVWCLAASGVKPQHLLYDSGAIFLCIKGCKPCFIQM